MPIRSGIVRTRPTRDPCAALFLGGDVPLRPVVFGVLLGLVGVWATPASIPPKSAYVSYILKETTLAVHLWKTGEERVVEVLVDRQAFLALAKAFGEQFAREPTQGEILPTEEIGSLGSELYALLIGPIEEGLIGVEHLVIIPDPVLALIPFAALCVPQGGKPPSFEYLIERFSISYLPNLDVLTEEENPAPCDHVFIVWNTRPLQSAEPLVAALALLGQEVAILQGIENLKERLVQGDVCVSHLHGGKLRLAAEIPWQSAFVQSAGSLSVLDIQQAQHPITFFALVGVQEEGQGEAFLRTMEALLSAKVQSLLVPVFEEIAFDAATALMTAFYENLAQGLSKAQALRKAQISLLKIDKHPFSWAGFVLYGDWSEMPMVVVDVAKLEYSLYLRLLDWQRNPNGSPHNLDILITFSHPVTEEDLVALQSIYPSLHLLGSFGALVVVNIPVPLLRELVKLPQIRRISEVPETIP